jgi:16S rRNA C1402 (ribose-2'-O) methylase RsmI
MVREGTKIHEEVLEARADRLLDLISEKPLGEFTLVVAGAESASERISVEPLELLRFAVTLGLSPAAAARRVAEDFEVPRSRLLRRARGARAEESPDDDRTL